MQNLETKEQPSEAYARERLKESPLRKLIEELEKPKED